MEATVLAGLLIIVAVVILFGIRVRFFRTPEHEQRRLERDGKWFRIEWRGK